VASFCERVNESSNSIKGAEFVDLVSRRKHSDMEIVVYYELEF
jgi:hypothetical protein